MFCKGIDFPNKIVNAIETNSLVIFAGAGASVDKPTSLPNFENLAKKIAEETGEKLKKKEPCEVFLGRLKAKGIDVNQEVAKVLSGTCLEHNKLHEAVVYLFKSTEDIKIVTTNYDHMFEHVIESRGEKPTIFSVPALPLGNDVNGIIHIHGSVQNPKYMVVTDEDFGRAYLTEGYASKFLVKLFETYTVLFIGYSYSDTILRYLTRAISRNTTINRYILTDDNKSDWSLLGIEPVYFKKRSFAVMREGLIRLGYASKKRLVDWKSQFSAIQNIPPKDITLDKEIEYCLEDYFKSKVLAQSVRGKEWLEYLNQKKVFSKCISGNEKESRLSDLWCNWLLDNFVAKDDAAILSLIYRNKNVISARFANLIVQSLLNNENIETNYLMMYLLILDRYITDSWTICCFIEMLSEREQYHSAFLLMKRMFEFNMLLEKNYYTNSENLRCQHYFISEKYQVVDAWKNIKDNALEQFPYEILQFVLEKINEIHCKYEMASQATKEYEPFCLSTYVIEDKEIFKEDVLDVLNMMFLDASNSIQNTSLLKTTLLQAMRTESLLLKKMILRVIRETSVFSEKEQLQILLSNDLINSRACQEQVFLMTEKILPNLNKKEKDSLIDAIENNGSDLKNIETAYNIYDWCNFLISVEPDNKRIDNLLAKVKYEHEEFQPRKRTQLIHPVSFHWSSVESPISYEELVHLPISEALNMIVSYKEKTVKDPSREGLLNTFSAAIAKNINWAKQIIEILSTKRYPIDVWQHVFYGFNNSDITLEDDLYILNTIVKNIYQIEYINGVSEFLLRILDRDDIQDFFTMNSEDFNFAAEVIWKNRNSEITKDFNRENVSIAVYNTIVGNILLSWIKMISLIDGPFIPENYKAHFEEALNFRSWERDVAICVLAGNFNYLCYRDMLWSHKNIAPYLTSNNKAEYIDAWEGMVSVSYISLETAEIISPIFYKALKNINWLKDSVKDRFVSLFLLLMIFAIEKPTLKYIPEFYKCTLKKDRALFIDKITQRLKEMDESDKRKWWNSWLKRFIENRTKNRPCILEKEEHIEIIKMLIALPEVFDEAVDIICKKDVPEVTNSVFWFSLQKMNITASVQHSMVKLLVKVLDNSDELSYTNKQYVQNIVKDLTDLDITEKTILQEVLLKQNIEVTLL